jgi:hypothetical protein
MVRRNGEGYLSCGAGTRIGWAAHNNGLRGKTRNGSDYETNKSQESTKKLHVQNI